LSSALQNSSQPAVLTADAKPFWSALYHSVTLTDTEDYEYRRASIYEISTRCIGSRISGELLKVSHLLAREGVEPPTPALSDLVQPEPITTYRFAGDCQVPANIHKPEQSWSGISEPPVLPSGPATRLLLHFSFPLTITSRRIWTIHKSPRQSRPRIKRSGPTICRAVRDETAQHVAGISQAHRCALSGARQSTIACRET
jgi:hypothetical protein